SKIGTAVKRREVTRGIEDSFRLGLLPMTARYSLAQWAHLRWTRMLLGRWAGNPLLRGSRGFWPVRGCRNHMNDLVAAAFELVENFGQREDGAGVNVVQQQDAPAARLDTADGASRNLAILRSRAPPDPETFCEWGGFWVWLATVWPSS